ncbi:MAG: Unknown protein [uncultured Sulfurovum sp.]|uniref:Uncharacterized protein n=1 Tax=uncultured Sulfurovum sp. TaxID=269237 RepID=A0A6S6T2Q2_9BACT|nr:MAG: Unknown protein [uncultured Sulfurovum sp.]
MVHTYPSFINNYYIIICTISLTSKINKNFIKKEAILLILSRFTKLTIYRIPN